MPNHSPLLLHAPMRVATFNIGASGVHSKLRILIRDFSQLEGIRLTSFQPDITHIKYILIDQMSFIGQNMFENIDCRLRQAFPQNAHISFVGRYFIMNNQVNYFILYLL